MAKANKTVFACGECGYETGKWLGQCPSCSSWNTIVEVRVVPTSDGVRNVSAQPLSMLGSSDANRYPTGIGEFDRVMSGGVVGGSVVLLGGDPGIGKSTLLMQVAASLVGVGKVLYVTGEESAAQIKLRAERLGAPLDILILAETDVNAVEAEAQRINPTFLLIDSIQTMYSSQSSGVAGSITQIREATTLFTRLAKVTGCTVLIVGHVTKDGALAGPRILEHMVDTVLYFEGDRHDAFRLLRAVKNRFGSTNEIGVFEMTDKGMSEIADPSRLFLSGSNAAGCAVTCAMEGTRPMLMEMQALISPTAFNNPRRMSAGIDSNRLILILAVLEKKAGLQLFDKDVYANIVGGIRLDDRACDLAVAMSIASALFNVPLPTQTAFIGEVSLTGEIRPVSRMDKRISECVRLGFSNIVVPPCDIKPDASVVLTEVKTISQAVAKQARQASKTGKTNK